MAQTKYEIRKGKNPSVNLRTKQLRLNRADLEQRYPKRKKVRKVAKIELKT